MAWQCHPETITFQKKTKNIQKYVLELYVIPLNAHDIVRLVTMYCVKNCTSDTSKVEIVRIGAKYDGILHSVSNMVYCLIIFCYELTTILSTLTTNKDNQEIRSNK